VHLIHDQLLPPDARPRGVVVGEGDLAFDWEGVLRPGVRWEELVVYEMHVRGFSVDAGGEGDGGFLGVVKRIPYLKSLGVNCVELLPVHEFNEREWGHVNPVTGRALTQYWGYSTVAFFAPMNRFGRDGATPLDVVRDFKVMVRELHRAGIEVVLDVVYNHTAEMGVDFLPPGHYGMKTLAPFSYYLLDGGGAKFVNHSGCGNTVNCNNVAVQELICESLKYWALEMGVDGFRFDLASVLCRGTDGAPMDGPPVIERMTKDPAMRDVKLIAEPWDCGGLYQVGTFPHHGVWAEWNGKFRDTVRRFVKGDAGMMGDFATRICGSADLYKAGGRRPCHSVNFVTAHDGFSMYDLVAYNGKHNDHNGERNNDGEAHNNSWNCGAEGETGDAGINAVRTRQMKNMLVALLTSAGTPMLCMGDEYAHTKKGNNNGWCQDSPLTWFSWTQAARQRTALVRFTQKLVHLRRTSPALQHTDFYKDSDVTWHGTHPHSPNWASSYNFIALVLHGVEDFYIAFNAGGEQRTVRLPEAGGGWHRVVDTNLESPKDFAEDPRLCPMSGGEYKLMPYSALVLKECHVGDAASGSELLAGAFELADISGLTER
jgi:isoamylase